MPLVLSAKRKIEFSSIESAEKYDAIHDDDNLSFRHFDSIF